MGGGVALNYALQKNKEAIAGYLLFSPLLGHNSPAIQQTLPIENDSIEPFMKIHITRIIGLKMLNEIGIHSQDSLPVLFFNLPESTPTKKYTYRANMSMAPDDYKQGLAGQLKSGKNNINLAWRKTKGFELFKNLIYQRYYIFSAFSECLSLHSVSLLKTSTGCFLHAKPWYIEVFTKSAINKHKKWCKIVRSKQLRQKSTNCFLVLFVVGIFRGRNIFRKIGGALK